MVPFAGWEMPVQYSTGILSEHLHTRKAAGLFDVSHMGQLKITGPDPAAAIEQLVPGNIQGLAVGHGRYTQLTADDGGILDDLIVTRDRPDQLFVVVNAGRAAADFAHLKARLDPVHKVLELPNQALLALQGPAAAACLARLLPAAANLGFMQTLMSTWLAAEIRVSRLGYTGEDGFEISIAADRSVEFAKALLAMEEIQPVGLGARDSLRLEAGLCLHGHDIDATTSPVEAALAWTIGKRRREEANFPGAERILAELRDGSSRHLVGLRPDGKAPAREGAEITREDGQPIGRVTSGGFGPTVNGPIAMGYVASDHAALGTRIGIVVRGKPLAAAIVELPFVRHRYVRTKGVKP